MGKRQNLVTPLHKSTKRDYPARMMDNKVHCMEKAKKYEYEYWDGDRKYGYGGYDYDGRWKPVAEALIAEYGLHAGSSILDIGCGKAYLLYEISQLLPEARIAGFDISRHALENAKPEIKKSLFHHNARDPLPFFENEFDLVISLNTIFNLEIFDLKQALSEMERVAKNKYIVLESYRNDQELFNLQCWALTCESFFSEREWIWIFSEFGYNGDYEFIYFE
ncbi:Methyltransferase type 11 [Desulfamplus magnetovallimortis]|uniref:Methyltransferase type 11 n=1 Tax=Desulfamplus magnetovallimortis TaxID=1246637 RepID=A0A1W1HEQ4_9BACT|nr:class I SAM-dependent methyltransferase [Desulfamplus magnetovallimortis]SLM30981.1 Methyltransferase type 11 [Desulfamplus magnetovallimortis]